MRQTRLFVLSAMVIAASFGSVCAQRRWERLPSPRDPQFYAPRNKLEEFETRVDAVLVKGQTWTGTLRTTSGSARVEAIEIRDTHDATRATGVGTPFASATQVPSTPNRPETARARTPSPCPALAG